MSLEDKLGGEIPTRPEHPKRCLACGKYLDDHSLFTAEHKLRDAPLCMTGDEITKGIRFP